MGWSFRKSKSFGPFRLNFSSSGIGMSVGVKGARISVNKRGTYVNFGANGIYYREKIGGGNNTHPNPSYNPTPLNNPTSQHTIFTEDVEQVTDVDSLAFIEELEKKSNMISFFRLFGLGLSLIIIISALNYMNEVVKVNEQFRDVFEIINSVANIREKPSKKSHVLHQATKMERYDLSGGDSAEWVKVFITRHPNQKGYIHASMGKRFTEMAATHSVTRMEHQPFFLLGFALLIIVLLIWCVYLYRVDAKRKTLEIYYTLDESSQRLHDKFLSFFNEFSSSHKIWQKLHVQRVHDTKYHGGASQLISRIPVSRIATHQLPSSFFKTNVKVPCIKLKNTEMYFFPERIIIKRANKFGAAFYKNISVSSTAVRFIEDESVPADASVVDYTWKYTNKSGGPDKRFVNNRRIPVCLYTEYEFSSDSGLEEIISTSKEGAMDNFSDYIKVLSDFQRTTNIQ